MLVPQCAKKKKRVTKFEREDPRIKRNYKDENAALNRDISRDKSVCFTNDDMTGCCCSHSLSCDFPTQSINNK